MKKDNKGNVAFMTEINSLTKKEVYFCIYIDKKRNHSKET